MSEMRVPRRPAILTASQADTIVGDSDPAETSTLAHASAWALLGIGDEEFTPEAIVRLKETVRKEGVDSVAHLWMRSPEFTLPGAMWRLYLLVQWCDRDSDLVRGFLAAGEKYLAELPAQASLSQAASLQQMPNYEAVTATLRALLTGYLKDDDLGDALSAAAYFMEVLAVGVGEEANWITEPTDPLAHPVTTRQRALQRTAAELHIAADNAVLGQLN